MSYNFRATGIINIIEEEAVMNSLNLKQGIKKGLTKRKIFTIILSTLFYTGVATAMFLKFI